MRLTNESCVHKCGRNILSSVLGMGQLTNIKQLGIFCSKKIIKSKLKELADFLIGGAERQGQKQTG
ncbi:MAG TPA: hypothetical protein VFE02_07855 [Candidatus Acidoferrales bacterium]|jgi:hypothetical protein|nr:hypothetical protein [Candidatus Acidoferrales bacterium]